MSLLHRLDGRAREKSWGSALQFLTLLSLRGDGAAPEEAGLLRAVQAQGGGVPSPCPVCRAVGCPPVTRSPQHSHRCCHCRCIPQLLLQHSSVDPVPVTYRSGKGMPRSDWLKIPW